MGSQKPRILPWLICRIGSQDFPGLIWLNSEKTQFLIPWKHGLRQDRCGADIRIFQAWAIDSGSYDPAKDTPNPAVWKRNFRAALNGKPEIHMIEDRSADSNNPHKIYEIQKEICTESDLGSVDRDLTANISPGQFTPNTSLSNTTSSLGVDSPVGPIQLQISYKEEDLYCSPEVAMDCGIVNEPFSQGSTDFGAASSTCSSQPGALQESQLNFIDQLFSEEKCRTDFEVSIYYRGTLVQKTVVRNPNGFRITSQQRPIPGSHLEDVVLPAPMIEDQVAVAEIHKLLGNLEHGILVEIKEGSICGKRQGRCRAYWSMTETPDSKEPNQINKHNYSVLYTFPEFVTDLIGFIQGTRQESPQYNIWICLGEFWPDIRPWKKKIIMVQIVPVAMRMLHEMSYSTGASSLRSSEINLQISDTPSTSTELMAVLREMQERMQCA
ncbi:hypothetical protein GDO86_012326 [Hymenochirus boettgeri]|uniref:IRF tryptophan pentad repeat domain-containing protein n=1 Tax=Hymenochirus boettgeri TaxID=247094 RepID=A0A8T2IS83_9PIPI|nr:hypothetical protein GDO86_012326 [Hymenochirus boettgeri]